MALSTIPLTGLPHRVVVNRYSRVSDSFGGVTDGVATVIYASMHCRITTLSKQDADRLGVAGYDSAKTYKVIAKYSPNVQRSDILAISNANIPAPSGNYRVLWLKDQIDDKGAFHHTSLVIEKDD